MGYHSSPTLAFLMTVFNVRLGWWLRNPRFREVWTDEKTGLSLRELLYELLGMTTDDRKWVYLSDGGHFENLGVYELVRRRCRFIIACDAGQDGDVTFEDLGNAIERCRADFGVDIEIDLGKLRPGLRPPLGMALRDRHHPLRPPAADHGGRSDRSARDAALHQELAHRRRAGRHPALRRRASRVSARVHAATSSSTSRSSRAIARWASTPSAERRSAARCAPRDAPASTPVEIFTLLRQRWGKPAPAPPDAVRKYSSALDRIWTTRAHHDDAQLPRRPDVSRDAGAHRPAAGGAAERRPTPRRLPDVNYWLPTTDEERRAGFYVCVADAAADGGRVPRLRARPALRPHRQPRLDEPVPALGVVGHAVRHVGDDRLHVRSALPALLLDAARSAARAAVGGRTAGRPSHLPDPGQWRRGARPARRRRRARS